MAVSTLDSQSTGIAFQNSVYAGIAIENVLYGIELLLYFKTIRILLASGGASKKSSVIYALFSSTMLFLVTVWIGTQAFFGQHMWLLDGDFPGGASAYWSTNITVWYMDWGTTAAIVLQLMTDALMIYRCWIIYTQRLVIVVPVILWLATFALGFVVDLSSSLPGGDFFTGYASRLGIAYYAVSVALHALLTCMICYRLVRHGRMVRTYLGRKHATPYFSAVTIFIESVAPYTVSGIAYMVSTGMRSSTSVAFVCVYIMMMCISPQMLILRVISGRASDNDTVMQRGSSIRFDVENTQDFDGNGTTVRLQTLSNAHPPEANSKV